MVDGVLTACASRLGRRFDTYALESGNSLLKSYGKYMERSDEICVFLFLVMLGACNTRT